MTDMETSTSTKHAGIRVALDIEHDFHIAGLFIPANAAAAYNAAAEQLGIELLITGDGSEQHNWQHGQDFEAICEAAQALHDTAKVTAFDQIPWIREHVNDLAKLVDEDGDADLDRIGAYLAAAGIDSDDAEIAADRLADWA